MKGQTSAEKRKKMRRSLERRGGNLRVNLFSTPTKKRKRNDNFQKESFIMKLFDRSLDLSKYNESSPLYPICRAWMLNQPRNQNILSYRELAKNADILEDHKLKRENNGAEMLRKLSKSDLRGDSLVVTALPAPLNVEVPKMPKFNEDYKPDLATLDEIVNSSETKESENADVKTKNTLLAEHKQKWSEVKSHWLKHSRSADKRYELNQLILSKLYKPQ